MPGAPCGPVAPMVTSNVATFDRSSSSRRFERSSSSPRFECSSKALRWMTTRYEPGGVVLDSVAVICVAVAVVTGSGVSLNSSVGVRCNSVKFSPDSVNTCVLASYVALLMTGNVNAAAAVARPAANTHATKTNRETLLVIVAFDGTCSVREHELTAKEGSVVPTTARVAHPLIPNSKVWTEPRTRLCWKRQRGVFRENYRAESVGSPGPSPLLARL